ncbi:TonB-dependent receptor domain-containing protein [Candidatus Rariloculus sp.]|uniref:TonB-dependent receptor domain-containing protein n=1 Tax=Candidatus Rariloculus sp. TaxID=3101265 RepID=UPI003D0BFCF9
MSTLARIASVALAAALLLQSAIAQDEQPDEPTATPETAELEEQISEASDVPVGVVPSSGEVEEIIVTGSRIRRDSFTAALPVTVITDERALLSGLANTSEILQSSALASGTQIDNTFGGFVVSGGPGANTFGLRSLDAGRTLVLVNGRRFTPAGTRGQVANVDLNSIPFVAVQRIEILKDGASSVYGADAVAGVVNIITRKRFDDFRIEADYQQVSDYGSVSLLYGKTWDRGYFDFAVEASSFGPVQRGELDYGFCDERPLTNGESHPSIFEPTFDGRCFGSVHAYVDVFGLRATPISAIPDPAADFFGTGLPWRELAVGLDGARRPEPGLREDRNWSTEDLYPKRTLIQAYSDGLLDFRIGEAGGTVSGTYELYFSKREDVINNGYRQIFPYLHPKNPTNPFGVIGGIANPVVMSYDLLDPETEVENEVTALTLGLEGDRGNFAWDVFLGYSSSRGGWNYDTWLKDKVARALSTAVDANGNLQCVLDPAQLTFASNFEDEVVSRIFSEGPDPACVPLDLVSGDALRGNIPADAANYIGERQYLDTDYDLLSAGFNLEGGVFDLPAGQVRGVLGMEWRSRELDDRPSRASVEDNQWGFTGAGRTMGDDTVSELYGELELPLVAGQELAEEFTLNASYRYTDYSSYGSDSTWRALINYAPTTLLRMRAAVGTSFRAPALYELFLANQTGFVASRADPCNNYMDPTRDLDPGSNLYQNCQSLEDQGIIPPDYSATSSLLVITGGNLGLEAETSDSKTLGLVITPDLAARFPRLGLDLSFAVDYYEIDLANSISRLGAGTILSRCYTSLNFSAQECTLVGDRRTDGQLSSVNSSFVNVAIEGSKGYDVTIRAEREYAVGNLSVDVLLARVKGYEYGLTGADSTDYIGRHAYPRWRGEADIRFDWRDFTFTWSIDYVGSTDEEPIYELRSNPRFTNVTNANRRFFHTTSARYSDPNGRYILVFGVRNLFDKEPPVVGWGPFSPSVSSSVSYNIPLGAGYDLLGRRVFASFSYSFASL